MASPCNQHRGVNMFWELSGDNASGRTAKVTVEIDEPTGGAPLVGVHFHATWDQYWKDGIAQAMWLGHLDELSDAGINMIRVDVGWSTSQPTSAAPDPAQWYNQRVASTLQQASARGMKVLLTIHQSPLWARAGTGDNVKQFPINLTAWKEWCKWAAQTWGDKVYAWEVWNEPNLSGFTALPEADRPKKYVPVLKAAHAGLKAGDADVVVVFGAPSYNDDTFIRACYRLGARGYFDVMATHPYMGDKRKAPESRDMDVKERVNHMPNVFAVMDEFGDGGMPVWWTEFGYPVHTNVGVPTDQPWKYGVETNEIAADYFVRTLEMARMRWPQVTVALTYVAYRATGTDHEKGFSMLRADGTVLPQLTALSEYSRAHPSRSPV